mmetsp:Transcript_25225/g.84534  ORF Transcript_25225/g.84534 Transcript_25225/m.84534 type:complete len:337 (+) Transcript_25225:344-1354(+)
MLIVPAPGARADHAAGEHHPPGPQVLQPPRGVRGAHRRLQARQPRDPARGDRVHHGPPGAPARGGAQEGGHGAAPHAPRVTGLPEFPAQQAPPGALRQGPGGDGRVPPRAPPAHHRAGRGLQGPRPVLRVHPQADHGAPPALKLRLPPHARPMDPDQAPPGARLAGPRGPARVGAHVRGALRRAQARGHGDQHRVRRGVRVRAHHHGHLPQRAAHGDGGQPHIAVCLVGEPQPQVPRHKEPRQHRPGQPKVRPRAPARGGGLHGGPRRDPQAQDPRPALQDDQRVQRRVCGGQARAPAPADGGRALPHGPRGPHHPARRAVRPGQRLVHHHDERCL